MINKYFLAKMNIPAYLKKFLYNRYGGIEIEGIPPIIFKGNGKNLLDYRIYGASGGVGDKTSNLFNIDDLLNAPGGVLGNATFNHVLSLVLKPNTTYIFSSNGSGSLDGDSNYNRSVYVNGSDVQNTIFNGHPYITETDNTGIIRIGILSTRENAQQYINKVAIIQLEEGSTVTDFEPYGYKVPVVISGKNLLPQINDWIPGYIGANGAINNPSNINKEKTSPLVKVIPQQKYTFSFFPNAGEPWRGMAYYNNDKQFISRPVSVGSNTPIIFTPPANVRYVRFSYRTFGDGTYAQLELGTATDYVPYIEPTTTNIYLDEPILENESISLSDTNINIPTFRGTNVLTVDTTVQPSNVYIKVGGG